MVELTGVIILGGGTARRLGGVSKPDVVVAGQRLLDRAIEEVRAVAPAAHIVAVVPDSVASPVPRVLEDPPLGGPLAGIAAGFAALWTVRAGAGAPGKETEPIAPDERSGDGAIGLLTCDAPLAPRLYPALLSALDAAAAHTSRVDGAAPLGGDAAGPFVQYALGVYRAEALARILAGPVRNRSIRRVFAKLAMATLPDPHHWTDDVDTPADRERLERRLAASSENTKRPST